MAWRRGGAKRAPHPQDHGHRLWRGLKRFLEGGLGHARLARVLLPTVTGAMVLRQNHSGLRSKPPHKRSSPCPQPHAHVRAHGYARRQADDEGRAGMHLKGRKEGGERKGMLSHCPPDAKCQAQRHL